MSDYSSFFSPLSSSISEWKSQVELTFTPQELRAAKNIDASKSVFKESVEKLKTATKPELQKMSEEMTEADLAYHLMMEIRHKLEEAFKTLESQLNDS